MNIVRENLEDLTTLLKVTVGEADYNEAVDKSLRTYRRKANIPGFRPGMVPMGIINKMYRKGVVAEEAYRTRHRRPGFDYIETEKLNDGRRHDSEPETAAAGLRQRYRVRIRIRSRLARRYRSV